MNNNIMATSEEMELLESLASYAPMYVVRHLHRRPDMAKTPWEQSFSAAVLYVDMAGVSALVKSRSAQATAPAASLSNALNAYFGQLVDFVKVQGGDVIKCSASGVLAIWPAIEKDGRSEKSLATMTRRAAQCGLTLRRMLHDYAVTDALSLSLRVGVDVGEARIAGVGGALGRWEILTIGAPVGNARALARQSAAGAIRLSARAHALIANQCIGERLPQGDCRLEDVRYPLPPVESSPPPLALEMEKALRSYIPGAVLNHFKKNPAGWPAEIRPLTVLSIHLPTLAADAPLDQIQAAMRATQMALYRHAGSVNALRAADAGVILTAAMGLPPLSHSDDPERGIQAALKVHEALAEQNLACAIGVATGEAFCGSLGSERRREYMMIGHVMTRAAALRRAARDAPAVVLCDTITYEAARHIIAKADASRISVGQGPAA
ncbi:MAG: adenylate/guanylate cyclase domain-containing protein [Anaerolineales bacterium]